MNPFVSIVTGTYNRLNYLTKMVMSVRHSIGVGIPYEIIIVDGGSIDGTIEWCRNQSNVVLIEHGKLLGAVKAFNDGAYKARGQYVILANDDIEFIDYSILDAISFMQDNSRVGIGCFYQDRYNKDWHVDTMSALVNGKKSSVYYGQVCIVPKWLGDKVGWWGDYLKTYGGDNELSCNVVEYGYKIEPIPCAMIHDFVPNDNLRDINTVYDKTKHKTHPDTEKWLKKWTRSYGLGPVVRPFPLEPQRISRMKRVFYAPIYESGWTIQKSTKQGMKNALIRAGYLVNEFDYMSESVDYLFDCACAHDADLFIMQLQDTNKVNADIMKGLRHNHTNAKFICWNGDYHPETLFSQKYMDLLRQFDLVGVVTTEVERYYKDIKWFYWQIGFEESNETVNMCDNNPCDVLFLANGYSMNRIFLADKLMKMKDVDVALYGSWPSYMKTRGNTLYDFGAGAKLYAACKIALSDNQWPHATGFVSNRLFQAMYAGAFLLQQRFGGMKELLGLVDGVHLIVWDTLDDLVDKIQYWLNHDEERINIAKRGQKFIIENHSFDVRVRELKRMLNE